MNKESVDNIFKTAFSITMKPIFNIYYLQKKVELLLEFLKSLEKTFKHLFLMFRKAMDDFIGTWNLGI